MRAADGRRDASSPADVGSAGSGPHLTFEMLLADTLHEMAAHEAAEPGAPDAVDRLRDEALVVLRTGRAAGGGRPLHRAYRRPVASAAEPPPTSRLDVRR
jgi:hypothetical protein